MSIMWYWYFPYEYNLPLLCFAMNIICGECFVFFAIAIGIICCWYFCYCYHLLLLFFVFVFFDLDIFCCLFFWYCIFCHWYISLFVFVAIGIFRHSYFLRLIMFAIDTFWHCGLKKTRISYLRYWGKYEFRRRPKYANDIAKSFIYLFDLNQPWVNKMIQPYKACNSFVAHAEIIYLVFFFYFPVENWFALTMCKHATIFKPRTHFVVGIFKNISCGPRRRLRHYYTQ